MNLTGAMDRSPELVVLIVGLLHHVCISGGFERNMQGLTKVICGDCASASLIQPYRVVSATTDIFFPSTCVLICSLVSPKLPDALQQAKRNQTKLQRFQAV